MPGLIVSGHLIPITPIGGDTSARNTLLLDALQQHALTHGGWRRLSRLAAAPRIAGRANLARLLRPRRCH
jgi:hypothetical protein